MSLRGFQYVHGKVIDLVEISPAYFHTIITWRNDPDIKKYFFTTDGITYEQQEIWYARYVQDETDMTYMIVDKTGSALGMVGLYNIDMQERAAEFGRLLIGAKQHRGSGFGKEACRMLLNLAFETLNLKQVYLSVYEWNVNAVGLYQALGFKIERRISINEEADDKQPACKMILHSAIWQTLDTPGKVEGQR